MRGRVDSLRQTIVTFAVLAAACASPRVIAPAPASAVGPAPALPAPWRLDPGVAGVDVALGPRACVLGKEGRVRCKSRGGAWSDIRLADAATAIAAGAGGTCALLSDGRVQCWGCDPSSDVAPDGATFDFRRLSPPAGRVTSLSVGAFQACVTTTHGEIECWGHMFDPLIRGIPDGGQCDPEWQGQMIRMRPSAAPYRVIAPPVDAAGLLVWLDRDGRVHPRVAEPPHPSGRVLDLAGAGALNPTMDTLDFRSTGIVTRLGSGRLCAALEGGALACWGADLFGAAGDFVSFPMPAVQVAVGERQVCARLKDGSVRCWGRAWPTGRAELDDVGARTEEIPYEIPFVRNAEVVRIASGQRDTACAVSEGAVTCWGDPLE